MGKPLVSMNVETRALTTAMKVIEKDALPRAVADTLNQAADAVTKQQIRNVKSLFTIRTPYTLKSMTVNRAKPYKALNKAMGKNVNKMFSRAGTFSKYLWKQEDGGTFRAQAGGPVPIATKAARTSKSPKRAIAKRFRLSPGSLKQGDYPEIKNSFIGTPTNGGKLGLYVRSGKKLTMLRNLDHDRVKIKKTGFHSEAVNKFGNERVITALFKRAAKKYFSKAVNRG
ncbi:MAG: hypothetical protein PQJ59_01820 [Spirochaetales bacterium]|nr:hypothetical protein [Spirochaetales bacterium]